MKRLILFALAGFVFGLSPAFAEAPHEEGSKAGKVMTMVGEVVDTRCYIGDDQDQKGESHKACAIMCAKAGAALAVLQEKTGALYLILPKKDGENPNTPFMDLIAQKVLVSGKVFEVGGLKAIMPAAVKKAEGAEKPSAPAPAQGGEHH